MKKINQSFRKLKKYCEQENFKGYDPYDGLNSIFFQSLPYINNNYLFRLIWIQLFKKNPLNLRRFVGIKKDYNPKGLGLFLIGYCNLYRLNPSEDIKKKIDFLSQKLLDLKSNGYSGACWGYNFDWQARAFFQPKYTPTVVATSFITEALLKAYQILKKPILLETAVSSSQFILKDLNRTYDKDGDFSFSYSPMDKTQVFNATLLGSKLLSQIYLITKDEKLLEEAKKSIRFVCKNQKENGSWAYGTLPFHQWVDSFHTGYNLECIFEYQKNTKDFSFSKHIQKGVEYYTTNFFLENGISKYYNNKIYPIDIHAPAQLAVTLKKLEISDLNNKLIEKVLSWTIDNMQSSKGCFYFQKNKFFTNKTPYIRWSQAWMFYALSFYITNEK